MRANLLFTSLSDADVKALGKRVNVDEIVSTYGDWRDTNESISGAYKKAAHPSSKPMHQRAFCKSGLAAFHITPRLLPKRSLVLTGA